MHVDGDVLARIAEPGGEQLLNEMLDVDRTAELRFVDFDSPRERRERFEQLVGDAVGVARGEDPVAVAMRYLMRAVQPVL